MLPFVVKHGPRKLVETDANHLFKLHHPGLANIEFRDSLHALSLEDGVLPKPSHRYRTALNH